MPVSDQEFADLEARVTDLEQKRIQHHQRIRKLHQRNRDIGRALWAMAKNGILPRRAVAMMRQIKQAADESDPN